MKIDRLQIRIIIGLMFVILLGILIFFLQPKENNKNNTTNEKIYIKTNQENQTEDNVIPEDLQNVGDEENVATYIIIDKLSGKLKSLNNNVLQVIVY